MASISVHAEKDYEPWRGREYGKVVITINGVAFVTTTDTFLTATTLAIKVIKELGLDKGANADT